MRVLYLNPFSQEISGPDESLRTLLAGLRDHDVEPHVVLPAPGPQVARYEAVGARVHYAPLAVLRRTISPSTALYPVDLLRATRAVIAIAKRLNVDLIHTNMEVLLEGGLAARLLRLPHVLHYRGNTYDHPRVVFDALTLAWTAASDHVYCISEATAGVFRRRNRDRKVEVLYNPVDVQSFQRASQSALVRSQLGGGPDAFLIGTVGRIHPRKDLETFVRAAALVAADEPRARFVVVGAAEAEIEHEYLQRLHALAHELKLEGRITFAGARRDIPQVMRALDMFMLTSRHEGFGRVVAEAMAAGLPVVVTDEGALPELVDNDRYGVCAPPGDAAGFAGQVLRLRADAELAGRLSRAAVTRALEFDRRLIAARVASRYVTLIEGRRRRAGQSASN